MNSVFFALGLALSILIFCYLVYVMVKPGKF